MSVEFTIFSKDGKELDDKLVIETPSFDIEPHDHAIYLAVKAEMARLRQGTSSSKTRAEVIGSTKKPWAQKGRGTARSGSKKSPVWVGGGVAFGPKPRTYNQKVNKKVKTLARKSAFAYKFKENSIKVVDNFVFEEPKAKNVRDMLKKLDLENKRVTILASDIDDNLYLSCRNFYNLAVIEAERASTYDLLDCEVLLVDKAGFEKLNDRLLDK